MNTFRLFITTVHLTAFISTATPAISPVYGAPATEPKPVVLRSDNGVIVEPNHLAKRRLLHTENSTTATRGTPIPAQVDHRDNFELFATVIGVLGGVTLITGFTAFCWSLLKKHKERVDSAAERETDRRSKEDKLLQNIFKYRQALHLDHLGSTLTVTPIHPQRGSGLETSLPQTTQDKAQTEQETEPEKTRQVFHNAVQAVIGEQGELLRQILDDNPGLVDQVDSNGDTLLHHAQDFAVARILLQHGANPNSINNSGLTPVHIAMVADNQTVLTLLLDWMEVITFDDASVLFHIAATSADAGILRYLVRRGLHRPLYFQRRQLASIRTSQQTVQSASGLTLLHEAVIAGNLDAVMFILETGLISVNVTDNHGNTPLHFAAINLEINTFFERMQTGTINNSNIPPDIINTLLDNGADINAQNEEGNTPIHRAVFRNNAATVQELLRHRPNLNLLANGYTSVELACLRNYRELVRLLIPESRVRGRERRAQLLQQIVQLNLLETLAALTPQTAAHLFDIDTQDEDGNTALHRACKSGRSEMVEALLRLGARRDIPNREGQTPRELASVRRHHISAPILELLDTYGAGEQSGVTAFALEIEAPY